ncbi:hypothetical protein P4U65_27995 [Bacillus pacificus]|nr:hypothetical protein [Bacillus pacificus]
MIKIIYSIIFAIIVFLILRSSLIPYIASNKNVIAILVIFIFIVINNWILNLINKINKKKTELKK